MKLMRIFKYLSNALIFHSHIIQLMFPIKFQFQTSQFEILAPAQLKWVLLLVLMESVFHFF